MIEFWAYGNKNVQLIEEDRLSIYNELFILRLYTPSEFCQLFRFLNDIYYWNVTEWRNFPPYFCIFIFKRKKRQLYSLFVLLVFAMRIKVF